MKAATIYLGELYDLLKEMKELEEKREYFNPRAYRCTWEETTDGKRFAYLSSKELVVDVYDDD